MGTVFLALGYLGTKKCNEGNRRLSVRTRKGDEKIELGELSQRNLEVCELGMGDDTKELGESCQEMKKGHQYNDAEHGNDVGG
ncbi:hypothetical protein N7501_006022 [Penicillium viridicatum]|nr:hypothetical protein N7501_006022 [Penicillium viridicatum]